MPLDDAAAAAEPSYNYLNEKQQTFLFGQLDAFKDWIDETFSYTGIAVAESAAIVALMKFINGKTSMSDAGEYINSLQGSRTIDPRSPILDMRFRGQIIKRMQEVRQMISADPSSEAMNQLCSLSNDGKTMPSSRLIQVYRRIHFALSVLEHEDININPRTFPISADHVFGKDGFLSGEHKERFLTLLTSGETITPDLINELAGDKRILSQAEHDYLVRFTIFYRENVKQEVLSPSALMTYVFGGNVFTQNDEIVHAATAIMTRKELPNLVGKTESQQAKVKALLEEWKSGQHQEELKDLIDAVYKARGIKEYPPYPPGTFLTQVRAKQVFPQQHLEVLPVIEPMLALMHALAMHHHGLLALAPHDDPDTVLEDLAIQRGTIDPVRRLTD